MIFVDCLKVSGNLEDIRVFKKVGDDVEVIMKIDGILVPNIVIPLSLYEEIDQGSYYDFYGVFKKSKDKVKNKGIVCAIKPAGGSIKVVKKLRMTVPIYMAFGAAMWFVLTYVATWLVLIMPIAAKAADIPAAFAHIHDLALLAGMLPVLFFLGCAVSFIRKTGNLETWPSTAPSVVIERFSKLHK